MSRRLAWVAVAIMALLHAGSGYAADYPSKVIKVIVPYGAGQATDVMCRVFIDGLKDTLKQTLVIENHPGANTNIGAVVAANAAPDGYTLLCTGNATTVANPLLYKTLGFDPDGFAPISGIAATGYVLAVNNKLKGKTLKDVMAMAKAAPKPMLVGLASTSAQVIYGLLRQAAGVSLTQVPYGAGNTSLFPDLIGDRTDIVIEAMPSAMAPVTNGQVTPLAITMPARSSLLPDVPTFKEAGYDVTLVGWNAFYAPHGTPPAIIAVLNKASVAALKNPDVIKRLAAVACQPMPTTPAELTALTKHDRGTWAPMVKLLDLKAS